MSKEDKYLDDERVLKVACQVKLRLPLKLNDGTEYRPERFGVPIPAGVMLPKTAIVMHKLETKPDYDEAEAAERKEKALAAAEAKLKAEEEAAKKKAEEEEAAKAAELAKTATAPAASAKTLKL